MAQENDTDVSRGTWQYKKCLTDLCGLAKSKLSRVDKLSLNLDAREPQQMCLVATKLNDAAKRSDTDAVGMVKCGALLIYTEILNIGSPDEQTKAADGICIFSWTCWERSRKERGCLEGKLVSVLKTL